MRIDMCIIRVFIGYNLERYLKKILYIRNNISCFLFILFIKYGKKNWKFSNLVYVKVIKNINVRKGDFFK